MIFLHCVFIVSTCPFRRETTRISSLCESGKFSAEFCRFSGLSISGSGGAICVTIVSDTFRIRNCYFVSCIATTSAGGIYVESSKDILLEYCCGELCMAPNAPFYALLTQKNSILPNFVSFITCAKSTPNFEGNYQTLFQQHGNISSTDINASYHKLGGNSALIAYDTTYAFWGRCTFIQSVLGSTVAMWYVSSSIITQSNFVNNSYNNFHMDAVIAIHLGSHNLNNLVFKGNSFSLYVLTTESSYVNSGFSYDSPTIRINHVGIEKCLIDPAQSYNRVFIYKKTIHTMVLIGALLN